MHKYTGLTKIPPTLTPERLLNFRVLIVTQIILNRLNSNILMNMNTNNYFLNSILKRRFVFCFIIITQIQLTHFSYLYYLYIPSVNMHYII